MSGRVYAITGAFGTLGSALAAGALAQGASVALIDVANAAPNGIAEGETKLVLPGVDLSQAAVAEKTLAAVAARFGRLDGLFNVAGGFTWEKIEGNGSESWIRLFNVNTLTALNTSRAAIEYLKKSAAGRVVNVGANGAVKAGNGMGAYAASKAGVHRLTESLAEELKPFGITVNAVLPSIIDTPANRVDMPDADVSTWVSAPSLATIMLFLASEAARDITGALIPVTGRVI
jgi:NAD(P)-dependent dehydrogenase (short-subunit alcohol dehydrogenase family)